MISGMSPGMQVRLHESRDAIPLARREWNALAAGNAIDTAFQSYEWFDTWWTAFGGSHRLFLLTLHEDGVPAGFLSLMRVNGPLGLRQLEFTGAPNADYQDFVLPRRRAEAMRVLCEALEAMRGDWDMIVLRNVRADSPTLAELAGECRRLGLGLVDMERQPCPTLRIRGREKEIGGLLDKYSVRRIVRRLEQHGPARFRTLDSGDEVASELPAFFEQHVRRWQGTRAPSPFGDRRYRDWYAALARSALEAGWLHFSRLDFGDRVAAYHYGFSHRRTLSWYKPSFNPDLQRDSPGTALIVQLARDAERRGLDELDFSGGLEPFKLRFSNDRRETVNVRIFSRLAIHRLFVAGGRLRGALRGAWHRIRPAGGNKSG